MADLNLVKKLREKTSCGIADCSKALTECGDDFEKAVDWLRKKGLSSAAKKAGRITAEGLVAVFVDGNKAGIIEVNSETDFVARNQKFQDFVSNLVKLVADFNGNVEQFKAINFLEKSLSIGEELQNQISIIGENINIRRIDSLSVNFGVIASYIHNSVASHMGKIAVLVALESSADKEKLNEIGKQIAMHIAAAKPDCLSIEKINPEKLKRETEILKEQARVSGKPESIIDKMIEGRIRKYYEEVVLLEQPFIIDDKIKIKDLLKQFSKENGETKITDFKLFIVGEGIEKKENDFASEVAEMSSANVK